MNEQIRELNLQAISLVLNGNDPDSDVEKMYIPAEFTKKFAELIVRKCIKDCRDMFVVDSVSWNLLNEKLEHFGVEE
jgi:hypothetical protein